MVIAYNFTEGVRRALAKAREEAEDLKARVAALEAKADPGPA